MVNTQKASRAKKKQASTNNQPLRVVGIGASAGGLEALRDLVSALPPAAAFSYVIAQRVSPTHFSRLVKLLAPIAKLTIQELGDGQRPEPGVIYITPPNRDVEIRKGVLHLTEIEDTLRPTPSIDRFFSSLARELGEHAVAIVLSGTGSHGAAGMRAVKVEGGITIVQEPLTAKYAGMPRSALRASAADLVMPPDQIGLALERWGKVPVELTLADGSAEGDSINAMLTTVRRHTGFNLSDYNRTTVLRRIARRLNILGLTSLPDYLRRLRTDRGESMALRRDTLISGTSFFRDPEAFASLKKAFQQLVQQRKKADVLRCWVAGCATGEEVYSLAMLLEEAVRVGNDGPRFLLFATDLDADALEHARAARYSPAALEHVPKALQARYFELVGDQCRVRKSLAQRVLFAQRNVIDDPPFSRLDVISCRNLLMCLNQPVQTKLLELFHYALSPGGYLFLGKSESIERAKDLFSPVDRAARLYQRREAVSRYSPRIAQRTLAYLADGRKSSETVKPRAETIGIKVNEQLVQRYAPASMVLAEDNSIIHFAGDLKPYLGFPVGQASMCLFDIADASLRTELRALVYRCRRAQKELYGGMHRMHHDGEEQNVRPRVALLPSDLQDLLIVSFEPVDKPPRLQRKTRVAGDREGLIIGELERQLVDTRAHLQTVVEKLQSTNEELLTVNEALQLKSAELKTTASDFANVKESLGLPLIVVDRQLLITQKNHAIEQVAVVQGAIEGQSLTTLEWRFELPKISDLVRAAIDSGVSHERVITNGGKQFYELKVMPYCGERRAADGAVLLFQNITSHKRGDERLALAATVFENTIDGIMITDAAAVILQVNSAFTRITGYSAEEVIGKTPRLLRSDRHDEAFRSEMWRSLRGVGAWQGEIWNRHKNGHLLPLWQTISSVRDDQGRIRRYISTFCDLTERKVSEERIYRLAHYDVVTKLPNRLLFVDRLEHALERSKREGLKMAVFFVDLDHFKNINDTLGHPLGDQLLQQVAKKLDGCLRRQDTVARIGGDEFTILLENIKGISGAETVSRKVLHTLSEPFCIGENKTFISGSIGISIYPEDGQDADTLLKNADLAMYRAKELGRNRYQFYARNLAEEAADRLRLQSAMRQAMVRQEFALYYQPLTHLEDRSVVGAEALIRWHHPTMGVIAPDRFIPLAEETRDIDVIGEWVLRVACEQLRAWLDAGFPQMRLAVNISGQQLKRGNLADIARKAIDETGCPAELMDLEITEGFIMREADQSIQMLKRLRDLGFELAIDDFGTGYSSLSYLKRIPFSKLKVDRSFVNDTPHDANNKAITKAIIGLGKSLGLTVVAEGIETAAQETFLIEEGCHHGQGFLYSPPIPANDFHDIMRAQPTVLRAGHA